MGKVSIESDTFHVSPKVVAAASHSVASRMGATHAPPVASVISKGIAFAIAVHVSQHCSLMLLLLTSTLPKMLCDVVPVSQLDASSGQDIKSRLAFLIVVMSWL